MSGLEIVAIDGVMEFSEVVAWGLIVGALVYGASAGRLPESGAVALATLAALTAKAMLLPLT